LYYELTILIASVRFEEYFKTTSADTRKVVADRLKAVANEAGSNTATKYYCEDTLG
jgi:deuterolysin